MKDLAKKYAPIAAAALGLLAIILFFAADAIVMEVSVFGETMKEGVNGLEVTFGKDDGKFVFMSFLTLLITIGGIACSVLAYLGKGDKFDIIAAACFALAMIFFFCTKAFYVSVYDVPSEVAEYLKLAAGSVLAAIFTLLSAVCAIAPRAMDKFLK